MLNEFKSLSFVAKSFLIVFFIVLFEGALRKWLGFPTLSLMFLRDFVVVFSLFYGLKYFQFRSFPEFFLLIWTFVIIVVSLLQNMSGLIPIPVVVIGIRAWIIYFWFSLLCLRVFSSEDVRFILKVLLYTVVPMVILATIQQLSPMHSFINKQPPGGGKMFYVVPGIVRPSGTFSFTIGYTTYLAMISPLVMWLMSDGVDFIKSYYIRLVIIGSYFLGALVSGSRGALMLAVMMLGLLFLSKMVTKQLRVSTQSILLFPLILSASLYLLAPIIERALDANISRIESASKVEDTSTRIVDTFIGAEKTWENFQIFGKGIGGGSNAAGKFMPGRNTFAFGENEIDRILNEGGVLGVFFEIIKILISFSGLIIAWQLLMKEKYTLPLLFWTYLTIQLLTATTTGQITVHAFTFFSLGLGWSFLKIYKRESL